jgi:predicted TIM-barrel fold metal-dependent hydrolase
MPDLAFFDCNVSFGPRPNPGLAYAATSSELLDQMDRCGVDQALATCAAQQFGSPIDGNEMIVAQTREHPRLHPAWGLLPAQTGEFPEKEALIAQMRAHGVRALWAWPSHHRYLLDRRTFGSLLEELTARHIPLFLPLSEESNPQRGWALAGALLEDFPQLTLVLTNQSVWGQDRYFRPLMEAYPNLYLETSHYELAHGLTDFHQRYGSDRWLFGSAYPARCMGGAMYQLMRAELPASALEAIAGANLRRLLAGVVL